MLLGKVFAVSILVLCAATVPPDTTDDEFYGEALLKACRAGDGDEVAAIMARTPGMANYASSVVRQWDSSEQYNIV